MAGWFWRRDGNLEGYVSIVTCPDDCHTSSTGGGGYHCDETNGMVQGRHYYYIYGYKTIGGIFYQGKNWVQSNYDREVSISGLTINLVNTDEK
jgi:hypothetical protein